MPYSPWHRPSVPTATYIPGLYCRYNTGDSNVNERRVCGGNVAMPRVPSIELVSPRRPQTGLLRSQAAWIGPCDLEWNQMHNEGTLKLDVGLSSVYVCCDGQWNATMGGLSLSRQRVIRLLFLLYVTCGLCRVWLGHFLQCRLKFGFWFFLKFRIK